MPKTREDLVECCIMKDMHSDSSKTIIIRRSELLIDDKESTVINFSDITTYRRLKKQEETNMLLKTLNTTVHHEMLAPLKANVQICERVLRSVKDQPHLKEMVQTLFVSSQMLMLHANDMLDQRIIENGSFVAHPTIGSPIDTIWDIINLISQTTKEKGLKIVCRTDTLNNLPAKLRFDQRRY